MFEPYLEWQSDAASKIQRFNEKILAAVWPGSNLELERALRTLSDVLHDEIETFMEHVTLEGDLLIGQKFYQISEWNPKRYHELSTQYDEWVDKCENLIIEATKAANWLADIVRRDVNPLFFATQGKFLLNMGDLLQWRTVRYEYTKDQKKGMPYKPLNSRRHQRTKVKPRRQTVGKTQPNTS